MPSKRPGLAASMAPHGGLQGAADVLDHSAGVVPVRPLGDDEAFVRLGLGQLRVAVVGHQGVAVVLVPHIRQALVEHQREDELLVVAGVNQPAQDGGGAPEVAFELGEGEVVSHLLRTVPGLLQPVN
jgi:hypothetical protein